MYLCGTLGAAFDAYLRQRAAVSAAEAYELQKFGLDETERLMDELEEEVRSSINEGETLAPRRSPGYGSEPLSDSREIIEALDATKKIGVSLTDSFQLVPTKSVTARCRIFHKNMI